MYCILCEQETLWETHTIICDGEYDFCNGDLMQLMTTCPPPEYDLDYWEWLFLQEPDEEFMEISNQGLMYSG